MAVAIREGKKRAKNSHVYKNTIFNDKATMTIEMLYVKLMKIKIIISLRGQFKEIIR
jgi:hypothetical protein